VNAPHPCVSGVNACDDAAPVGAMYAIVTFEDGIKVIKSLNALLTLGWKGDIGQQLFETREQLKKDIRSVKVSALPRQMGLKPTLGCYEPPLDRLLVSNG
jgi:hypothetical protein